MDGLEDDKAMAFKIRSMRGKTCSTWTTAGTCIPGAASDFPGTSMLGALLRRLLIENLPCQFVQSGLTGESTNDL
jgi:hypothetical protein